MAYEKIRGGHKLVLGDIRELGQVRVDMEAFFEFSFWLAEELEDLISRHANQATCVER